MRTPERYEFPDACDIATVTSPRRSARLPFRRADTRFHRRQRLLPFCGYTVSSPLPLKVIRIDIQKCSIDSRHLFTI